MKPTLEALARSRRQIHTVVDRFIAANTFPLTDPDGVTFVWRGKADAVRLRTWAYGIPGELALERVGVTDLWALRIEVPAGTRLEYKFEVLRDGGEAWILDPLNPLTAADPFGANSVCRATGYLRPDWSAPIEGVPRGTLDTVAVAVPGADTQGTLRVWLPARFRRSRRYPLLVVHDGGDFFEYAALGAVLDNLSARFEIPDLVVALHEPTQRTREYTASDAHARLLTETWLPALRAALPLDGTYGLLGASLGGVASLHAAWRAPTVWRHLGLLSGSFVFSDVGPHDRDALFNPVARFMNAFRREPQPLPAACYVACGRYERLINENRALVALLGQTAPDLRFDEVPDGHHWECWRDRMRDALGWMFASPLWMVYE